MVYRIQPGRRSRAVFFLWAFAGAFVLFSPLLLVLREQVWVALLLLSLAAALVARQLLRQWERVDWFTPEPPACFLTLVDEGLLLEIPARGFSLYTPWRHLQCRRYGKVLQLVYQAVPVAVLSLRGVGRARRAALLAQLHDYTRGKSTPSGTAPRNMPGLPPLPAPAALPPPRPVAAGTTAFYSNTYEQSRQVIHWLSRPDWVGCVLLVSLVGVLGFFMGNLWCGESQTADFSLADRLNHIFVCFLCLNGALWLLYRLAFPGRRGSLCIPGPVQLSFSRREVTEQMESGAWSRYRLPEPGTERLVCLRSCCCLWLGEGRTLLLNAGDDLPPELESYARVPAPGNGLRVVLAALVMLLAGVAGLICALRPTEAELAFRHLPATPDAAALRQFATHYANGQVLGTPSLVACELPPEDDAGYMLCFTDSAPDPDDDDGSFHLAWETCVLLYPSGKLYNKGTWPVEWCPCDDWLNGPPDWLRAEDDEAEDGDEDDVP